MLKAYIGHYDLLGLRRKACHGSRKRRGKALRGAGWERAGAFQVTRDCRFHGELLRLVAHTTSFSIASADSEITDAATGFANFDDTGTRRSLFRINCVASGRA